MDLSAYHGDNFQHRQFCVPGMYTGRLNTAVLMLPRNIGQLPNDPDKYQFADKPDIQKLRSQLKQYKNTLQSHGTGVITSNTNYINGIHAADRVFGADAALLLSRMSSEVRKPEETEHYQFAIQNDWPAVIPYATVFEVSNIIHVDGHWFVGDGVRSTEFSIRTVKKCLPRKTHTVTIPENIQHLMGVLRPLPDGKAAVRSDLLDSDEIVAAETVAFEEHQEMQKRQGFNFVTAADGTILLPDDVHTIENRLNDEGYSTDTVRVDEIRKGTGGLACVTGRIN